jgi:hypothetical protein
MYFHSERATVRLQVCPYSPEIFLGSLVGGYDRYDRTLTTLSHAADHQRVVREIAPSHRPGRRAATWLCVKDQKIVVVEEDVALVRSIFQPYLELGSLNLLMNALRKRGIRTKVQRLESGRTIGGIPFTRGPLSYLLRNRFFVGEVVYKGEVLPGKVDLLAALYVPAVSPNRPLLYPETGVERSGSRDFSA